MKKKKFIITLIILLLILISIGLLILKPKYELYHSVKLLKETNYKEAYLYINNTSNEKNKKIIKELTTMILLDYMSGGLKQMSYIATEGTDIINKATKDGNIIDYSLDDNLNIYVKKLKDYVEIKNKISKEMILDDLHESYKLYFNSLEFININFIDMLNYIKDENFLNSTLQIATDLYTISADINSVENNYKFDEKTKEIFKELDI